MRLTLTPQHRNRLLTCLILALNAALLTGGALAESRLPLGRTDDAHLKPPSYEGTPRPAVAPPRPAPHVPSRIVYAFEHPAKTRLVYSAELSRPPRHLPTKAGIPVPGLRSGRAPAGRGFRHQGHQPGGSRTAAGGRYRLFLRESRGRPLPRLYRPCARSEEMVRRPLSPGTYISGLSHGAHPWMARCRLPWQARGLYIGPG